MRAFALAAVAGALAATGHAPFDLWPLALAGFAGLVWLISRAGAPGAGFRLGWAAGAGYFAVALHWIVEPFLVDAATHGWMAPFALLGMAGGLALFWALAGWGALRLGGGALTVALALALAEIARGHVLTGFPWALPAYVWTETPVRVSAAIWGPYGLTALTLALAAVPAMALSRVRRGVIVAAGLAGLFVAGTLEEGLPRPAEASVDLTLVRLVQPNAPQDEKWDPARVPVFLRRLVDFTAEPAPRAPDLVIWPETAIPYPLDVAGPVLEAAARASAGAPVITGINRRTEEGDWFNALVTIGEGGEVAEAYDKVRLVPFGEYIPFRIDLIRRMAAFTGFGFTPGAGVRTIDTPLGAALPLICYEAIFPGHLRAARTRPDVLLQITNDAWFGTFAGPFQHLQQARFRAAEQGLPLVRAANTGISAVVGPWGEVVAALELGEAGYLDVLVPPARPATLYAKTGDLPVIVALLLAFAGLARARRRLSH